MQPDIAVVHLVRANNGPKPLQRFLASYRKYPAGIAHSLAIVFKGFPRNRVPSEYETLLTDHPHERIFVDDSGYDIAAYVRAAWALDYEYLCFLNSFSVILCSDWLSKLYAHLKSDDVGVVGATGSWQSIYSGLSEVDTASLQYRPYSPALRGLLANFPFLLRWWNAIRRPVFRRLFDPFPNHHLRTNAFMLRKTSVIALEVPRIMTKLGARVVESGKRGLTKQILGMKKLALVIGKDGKAYRIHEWHRSRTFWLANQENLLVADNQTQRYEIGSPELRRTLSRDAWGEQTGEDAPERSAG